MCYSNSSTSSVESISKKYNRIVPTNKVLPTYYFVSGFSFPEMWSITENPKIQCMQWGLIPKWYKGELNTIAAKTLNARIETLDQRASFRNLIKNKHCVIPSNGFYEWQSRGKEKIPYFIQPRNSEFFSFAGLYDIWTDINSGRIIHSFSIVTTEANSLMSKIHNSKKRMPFVLKNDKIENWISGEFLTPENSSIQSNEMRAYRVDKNLLLNNCNIKDTTMEIEQNKDSQIGLFD